MTLEDHIRARLAPGLYPFQSHWMDVAGQNMHYLDVGSGEPLVLLHGNPTWSFFYRRVIGALAPGYRLVAAVSPPGPPTPSSRTRSRATSTIWRGCSIASTSRAE
jgi:pimeloyl-ACP methyl ester carboxylesterase